MMGNGVNAPRAYRLENGEMTLRTPEECFPFLETKGHVVSLVGGGGKTTLLYYLAQCFCRRGLRTVVMTTTKIGCPDDYCSAMEECCARWQRHEYAVCGTRLPNGKLDIPEEGFLAQLLAEAEAVVVEADGAKRLPCKAPATHEPVILPQTDIVVAVMGLDALGKPVEETCFRHEIVRQILQCGAGHILSCEDMAALLMDERGSRKGVKHREFYVVLNKCDDAQRLAAGKNVLEQLKAQGQEKAVLTSGMNPDLT